MAGETDLWKRYCQWLVSDPALGISLDVSRVRFPDDYIAKMTPAMQQAFEAMQQLEAGGIANRDENRMVGHYWLRAPELAPTAEITAEIRNAANAIRDFAQGVRQGKTTGAGGTFENLLHVGIGGSALGPQFVSQALAAGDRMQIHFVDNTDPQGIDDTIRSLSGKLDRTLVTVVSKSGGTPDTRNGMLEVHAAYDKAGVPFGPHAVAVTQQGSKLDQTAEKEGWLRRFPMWDWVGGRTSVMSAVGLVPAALQGIDIDAFLRGAAAMDEWTRLADVKKNPASLLSLMWYFVGNGRGAKDMVIIPYKDRLALFSRYLQQLVMESLGKQLDRDGNTVHQGIAVYGNKGSTDQHAYVQQLRDGVPNFFATFVQVLDDRDGSSIEVEPGVASGDYLRGFLLGTRRALYENGRDSITIAIDDVTPFIVGAMIALYERAVGLYGELVNVNAYNQPGVEAGKKAAAAVLELQKKVLEQLAGSAKAQTAAELAEAVGQSGEVETAYKTLQHLARNGRHGVVQIDGDSPDSARFERQTAK